MQRFFIPALLLSSLCIPSLAQGEPWDGPRVVHDGAAPDRALPLHAIPGSFSVTWTEERGEAGGPDVLQVEGHRLLRAGLLAAPRLRTEEYRLDPAGAEPQQLARALGQLDGVAVAAPLFSLSEAEGAAWRAVTPVVLVQLADPFYETVLWELADSLGVRVEGPRGLAPDQWRVVVPPGSANDPVAVAMALHASPATRWAEVSWINERIERFVPEDDNYPDQWHLDNSGQFGGTADNDINGPEAWDIELGSPDVVIAILDSGVDMDHPDLEDSLVPGWDFLDNDDNPNPNGSSHGTSCAGTACAPAQGLGVVGSCPGCLIMPIRMLGADDETEAEAVDWAVQNGASIISNSWGPTDGTGSFTPISGAMATAVDFAVSSGRDGLGVAIFWAAGNGHPADTCDLDGFVAYPSTFAVAASSNLGQRSSYSELCAELDFTAPSSGGSNGTAGIATTNIGGYTSSFGGTSAASPLAAGVGGLVLSALPDLSWEALREVLQDTAHKLDPGDADYDANGHSLSYGYGRIDAAAALQTEVAFLTVAAASAACDDELPATVQIPSEPGLGSVDVTALSVSDSLVVALLEDSPGVYSGTIPLTADPADPDDGLLSVQTGDIIQVSSTLVDDTALVSVDCDAPEILDPRVEALMHWGAQVLWETSEPADSFLDWGTGTAEATTFTEEHMLWALDLEPCTTYTALIRSTDPEENSAELGSSVGWVTPGDPSDLPEDALEGANPCDPSTWYPGDDDDAADDDDTIPGSDGRTALSGSGDCSCSSSSRQAPSGMFALVLALGLACRRRRPRPV